MEFLKESAVIIGWGCWGLGLLVTGVAFLFCLGEIHSGGISSRLPHFPSQSLGSGMFACFLFWLLLHRFAGKQPDLALPVILLLVILVAWTASTALLQAAIAILVLAWTVALGIYGQELGALATNMGLVIFISMTAGTVLIARIRSKVQPQ